MEMEMVDHTPSVNRSTDPWRKDEMQVCCWMFAGLQVGACRRSGWLYMGSTSSHPCAWWCGAYMQVPREASAHPSLPPTAHLQARPPDGVTHEMHGVHEVHPQGGETTHHPSTVTVTTYDLSREICRQPAVSRSVCLLESPRQ